jgi:phosphatidylglycerol:prolipoprotein diacylglycerol transferase
MNGCCFGRVSLHHLPWATIFTDPDAAIPREFLGVPLHPAQLYEAAGDVLLAAFLYVIVLRGIERGRFARGLVCVGYLVGYGMLRFVLEWFRGDTKPYWGGISVGQALAFGMMMLSVIFFLAARRRDGGRPQDRVADKKVFDAPDNERI